MPERIWLGQFNIVGGNPQEQGPYVATNANRSVADAVADLYLAIQPTRPDRDQLCAEVQQAIGANFGRAQYSITGNLLLCLSAAHRKLRDWNRASLAEDQMTMGVSCLAVQGAEAYVAQSGPAVAFYRHNGRVERLEPQEGDALAPLGQSDAMSPWFHRLHLEQDDAVLLLSAGLAQHAGAPAIEQALTLAPADALSALFRIARALPDCGALLLGVLQNLETAPEERDELAAVPLAVRPQPESQPQPERARAPERPLPVPPERPRRSPSPLGRFSLRRVQAGHPDDGTGVLRIVGSELPKEPRPVKLAKAAPEVLLAAAQGARPNLRVGRRHPSFRNAFLGSSARRRALRAPSAGIAAVLLIGLFVWQGIPALMSSGRTQRFQSLVSSAQSELNQAQNEQDLSKRRELLNLAQSNADEAKRLKPADTRAASESSNASAQLTIMNAIYNLPDVPDLASLADAGLSPSTAVEVAVGDRYYVLDVSAGKVYGVASGAGAQPEVVFEDGSNVDSMRAVKAQHIAWQPPAGASDPGTLLILDANQHLFGLSRNNLRSLVLRGVDQWKAATAMAFSTTDHNLYVLDAPGGHVWKYAPTDMGFDSIASFAVDNPVIRNETQLSVISGVFLTGQDAQIRRFLDSQETQFKLAGIDRDPVAPSPPLVDPGSGQLYIADRGNSRVIVLQGDGRFLRQLVHARLAGLRGLAIDQANHRLVGVIGQSLVAIPLPN